MSEEQRLTSADIKKQIEAKKEELKNSGLPITGQLANEINASASTPAIEPVKSEPEKATKGVESSKTAEDAALKDWAKKKGIDWTTDQDVLSGLRKSDQAFHEKRAKDKLTEPTNQYVPPPYTPPVYQPAPTPYAPNNLQMLQNVARDYQMTVEDADKLIRFNRDFYAVASKEDREKHERELELIKRENRKNSVFRELSSDPALRQPHVAMEYQRVLEEMQASDPQSFEQDPNAYIRALDKAQINIFRRNLQGQELQEGVPPIAKLPLTPPRPLGMGNGGGASEDENSFDMKSYIEMPSSEKRKILEKMGLVAESF